MKNRAFGSGIRNLLLLGDLLLELARLLPQRLHLFPAPLSLSLSPGHTRAQAGSRRGPWRRRYPDGLRHRHQHAAVTNNHGRPSFVASSITDTSRTRHSRPMKAQPVLTSSRRKPITPDEWPHEIRLRSAPQQTSNGQGDFFSKFPFLPGCQPSPVPSPAHTVTHPRANCRAARRRLAAGDRRRVRPRGSPYLGMVVLERTPGAAPGAASSPLRKSPRFSREVASLPSDPILPYLRYSRIDLEICLRYLDSLKCVRIRVGARLVHGCVRACACVYESSAVWLNVSMCNLGV